MKIKIIFVLIVIIMLGCASKKIDLVKNGIVSVEKIYTKGIYISQVSIYQDNNDLIISGWVKRGNISSVGSGHINIIIIDPNGQIVKQLSTYYVPRMIHRKGKKRSFFKVRLPDTFLSPGSKIRVVYHKN